jgi:hypothetical protein
MAAARQTEIMPNRHGAAPLQYFIVLKYNNII